MYLFISAYYGVTLKIDKYLTCKYFGNKFHIDKTYFKCPSKALSVCHRCSFSTAETGHLKSCLDAERLFIYLLMIELNGDLFVTPNSRSHRMRCSALHFQLPLCLPRRKEHRHTIPSAGLLQ